LPNAEVDRYVLKTKVVATALNAENAQSQKPQAATAPRSGGVPVTRRRLARGFSEYRSGPAGQAITRLTADSWSQELFSERT
jgi:hypothetical protein